MCLGSAQMGAERGVCGSITCTDAQRDAASQAEGASSILAARHVRLAAEDTVRRQAIEARRPDRAHKIGFGQMTEQSIADVGHGVSNLFSKEWPTIVRDREAFVDIEAYSAPGRLLRRPYLADRSLRAWRPHLQVGPHRLCAAADMSDTNRSSPCLVRGLRRLVWNYGAGRGL